MKIARFADRDNNLWGFVVAEEVHPVTSAIDLLDAITDDALLDDLRSSAGPPRPLSSVRLLAPIPRPPQFIGVGLNYRSHAEESGFDVPTSPLTFPFYSSSIIGPGHPIEIPAQSNSVDWEAELAIVIGKGGRDIPIDRAVDHIAGYTIVNDVSARDIQVADVQWSRAKSFDTFKPMGPWITMRDELGDASAQAISLTVNDEVMQSSTTADLIFPVPELVSYISGATTLLPGAVISTGTPAGIGLSRTPPQFLQAGDTVSIEVAGIGQLVNPVR